MRSKTQRTVAIGQLNLDVFFRRVQKLQHVWWYRLRQPHVARHRRSLTCRHLGVGDQRALRGSSALSSWRSDETSDIRDDRKDIPSHIGLPMGALTSEEEVDGTRRKRWVHCNARPPICVCGNHRLVNGQHDCDCDWRDDHDSHGFVEPLLIGRTWDR